MEENETTSQPLIKDRYFGLTKISFWKEHISLIVLVPYIIGGFWQLCELASIKLAYVRFFSFSQSIADGLLVLFLIIQLFVINLILNNIQYIESKIESWTKLSNPKQLGRVTWLVIYLSIGFIFSPIMFAFDWLDELKVYDSIVILLNALLLITGVIYLRKKPDPNMSREGFVNKTKFLLQIRLRFIIVLLYFLFVCFSIFKAFKAIDSTFMFPPKSLNIGILHKEIKAELNKKTNNCVLSVRVKYFNDNYIFWEVTDRQSKTYIFISDFEEITSENLK